MDLEQADQIIKGQRAEIARLREAIRRLADQDATLSVCDSNVTVTMDVTLTDEEWKAIREALEGAEQDARLFGDKAAAADAVALRGLLERLG